MKQNYYFLPYNKNLKQRANELLKNQTPAEIKIYTESILLNNEKTYKKLGELINKLKNNN